ncbi:hypothetical protein [Pseudodesulfovibrio indicus]|uniref:hypothetical protein n=1 Tax=Pseudodesulfovibrio indicus TaxID=1716143 RepID=UPI00293161E1|nr:hypothetical protein [Pseudodesulfovibrio indicus]
MQRTYPSDYEDVFQLLLNLVQETKREGDPSKRITAADLEGYFHRLSMGSLGEYEFMRRMAFYGHPVMRIAAMPILWTDYSQPVSPDFITIFNNEKVCVEVKNYKWDNHLDGFVVPKRSVDNCIKFKEFFQYDRACLAVKRFERWYMFDLEKIKKRNHFSNYLIDYAEMSKADLLDEPGVIFQLWSTENNQKAAARYAPIPDGFTNTGILYPEIKLDDSHDYTRLRFCNSDGKSYPRDEECEVRQYKSTQRDIIAIVYETIESNLREVYSCGYDWQAAIRMNIEDIIPSVFSIHDRMRGETSADELEGDIDTLASNGVMFKAARENCLFYLYRIATNLYNELSEQLEKDGLTFKDIMAYMEAIRSFKKKL